MDVVLLVANWGLPLAAIGDTKKSPEIISPKMTSGKYSMNMMGKKEYSYIFSNI